MPPKTGADRVKDSLSYLKTHGLGQVADNLLRDADYNWDGLFALGDELGLGTWIHTYAPESRRRALRALLLCQRFYFDGSLFRRVSKVKEMQTSRLLEAGWKEASVRHWHHRDETEIQRAIAAFMATEGVDEKALAVAAEKGQPPGVPNYSLTITRQDLPEWNPPNTCYAAVFAWLFLSGLVSYRWFIRNSGAENRQALEPLMSPAKIEWGANDAPFLPGDTAYDAAYFTGLRDIPRGHIVHLYSTEGRGQAGDAWNGHWLVSVGCGYACGCNNSTEKSYQDVFPYHVTKKPTYDRTSLNAQFYDYKLEHPAGSGRYESGAADSINPLNLRDRQ